MIFAKNKKTRLFRRVFSLIRRNAFWWIYLTGRLSAIVQAAIETPNWFMVPLQRQDRSEKNPNVSF